jgi:hypothetical protein
MLYLKINQMETIQKLILDESQSTVFYYLFEPFKKMSINKKDYESAIVNLKSITKTRRIDKILSEQAAISD